MSEHIRSAGQWWQRLLEAAEGRGIGSEASVAEELRGCAEIVTKNGWTEWASHLTAKADALDSALGSARQTPASPEEPLRE